MTQATTCQSARKGKKVIGVETPGWERRSGTAEAEARGSGTGGGGQQQERVSSTAGRGLHTPHVMAAGGQGAPHGEGRPRAMPGGKSAGRQGHPPPHQLGIGIPPPAWCLARAITVFQTLIISQFGKFKGREILKLFTCCPNFQILKNKEICLVSAMYEHCRQSSHSQSSKSHVVSRGSTKITQQATK